MQNRGQRADASPVIASAIPPARATRLSINGITSILVLLIVAYPGWNLWFRFAIIAVFAIFNFTPGLSRHSSIFCRCLLPLLIGAVCVEAYMLLNALPPTRDLMKYFRFHEAYNETFYAGISTLYAIITALALVKGIEDFDAIKKIIAEEAYRLRTIDEMARYFDTSDGSATRSSIFLLRRTLARYAANVTAMRDKTIKGDNLSVLRESQQLIASLVPQDANDQNSLSAMMAAHGELGTLRAKRIGASGDKIPTYLIIALWAMALALILPFMARQPFGADGLGDLRFGQYYIIFVMGAVNSFLLLMLSDISDPFDGFWRADLTAFTDLTQALEEDTAPAGEPKLHPAGPSAARPANPAARTGA
jgi:hypothetical protein